MWCETLEHQLDNKFNNTIKSCENAVQEIPEAQEFNWICLSSFHLLAFSLSYLSSGWYLFTLHSKPMPAIISHYSCLFISNSMKYLFLFLIFLYPEGYAFVYILTELSSRMCLHKPYRHAPARSAQALTKTACEGLENWSSVREGLCF